MVAGGDDRISLNSTLAKNRFRTGDRINLTLGPIASLTLQTLHQNPNHGFNIFRYTVIL